MTISTPALASQRQWFGHPVGLYVCFFTEMWERFAFYGLKALLFLYLTKHHLFSDSDGYLLLGTYAGLAYALPVVGGLLADKYLGMRKAVTFGGALMAVGMLGMAYRGHAATVEAGQDAVAVQIMYLSLALVAVGVGFLKPNISTIVGRLYSDTDPRRDSAFTLFYMGINLGAFASSLFVGWIGEAYGWEYGFGSAGIGLLLGLVVFGTQKKHLHGQAEPQQPELLSQKVWGLGREKLIYLLAIAGVLVVQQILQIRFDFGALAAVLGLAEGSHITATEVVAIVLTIALLVWWFKFIFVECSALERANMIVLMVLIAISAVFWGLYEQTYGTWLAYSDRVMNSHTFNFGLFDFTPNAAQLTSAGALFIFLLAIPFAWLWPVLDRKGWNPSAPAKFALGLLFAGLAHFVLQYAALNPQDNGLAGFWWFILAYLVLEIGEMALSPIGLSAVTALSVARVVSLMMGVWFLASAFGEMIAGRFGTLAAMPQGTSVPDALAIYADVFATLGWIGVGSAVLMFVLTPLLNRQISRATAQHQLEQATKNPGSATAEKLA
ncbi:peptide MFS transporter [Rheinheimera sp.]|uniref:peptide MFS transporter n=1 Tax=Rheinheimera sp. TaxID=1869214 RepID=UPI002FDDB432